MNVTVMGAGAWGTAVALHVARRWPVMLWARAAPQVTQLQQARVNERYLPDFPFPDGLSVTSSLSQACEFVGADGLLVVACPTAGLRAMFAQLGANPGIAQTRCPIVWLAKGLEVGSGLLPHQIAAQELSAMQYGVVSGPSFAQEVAAGLPAALVVASSDSLVSERVADAMHHSAMRIYFSDDITGVEVGGAMKNVIAIAAGICDGLQLGANARAALMTRGLAEIARLGQAMGGRSETFMGLTGMGDLVLTCATDLSRNRRVGLRLASGETVSSIVASLGHVAEGVPCSAEAIRRAQDLHIDMPIARAVGAVITGQMSAREAVSDLLAREPVAE